VPELFWRLKRMILPLSQPGTWTPRSFQFRERELILRAVLVHVHGERVVADDVLLRLDPVRARELDLLGLHRPARVGDVHCAVDERGDARARTAAGDRHGHVRLHLAVRRGPGLGDREERVGALVLDDRVPAAALVAATSSQQTECDDAECPAGRVPDHVRTLLGVWVPAPAAPGAR
jgi:hypothetical protein